ncbi:MULTISPECIES: ABC transporter permease [Metabacillus]|jgi:putative hydroxymethylpyrimidine transport system permease protein|uniref:ABC transporter permease n=1 Tax=Metabacillus rhizolycopersici TaxID=2875709 RepID=A0ABS7UUI1_9BACI|nr:MULTISPECIES: ABC transporter permease [Metabacillus]MBZ5751811.1 ABC transporter permease [Metabacillus rhizolycopersici]MCM3652310.1 ABC transporter permease [Metabacillus litoralis]
MRFFKKYAASTLLVVCLLLFWEVGARFVNMGFILPTPSEIILKLWELKKPLFTIHLPATLLIIVIGLMISIVFGVGLAVWMSVSKTVERTFYPLIITSQMIPMIALAPIFVLWFGYSIWSKIVVTVLITFFPLTVNTFDGLRSTSKEYKELLLTMGASKRDIFFKLQVPASAPHFFSGLKVAVTLSVIGAAIGEWIGAQAGLGYFSRRMMTQFDGAGVFAPIALLSVVGIILFILVVWLEKRTLKWRKTE